MLFVERSQNGFKRGFINCGRCNVKLGYLREDAGATSTCPSCKSNIVLPHQMPMAYQLIVLVFACLVVPYCLYFLYTKFFWNL